MELIVDGKPIATRDQGFLADQADWSTAVALLIAEREQVVLSDAHWEIIHFMRAYYRDFQHLPNNRQFTKAIQKALGADKGNSRYLHGLFPGGPLRQVCKIGGLPRPPSCIV